MEKTLGQIIKHHRVKSPFDDMTSDQKLKFSQISKLLTDTGGGWDKKIYLEDFKIEESKTEINRQCVNGLVDAINNLANSIFAMASHKNQSTSK